MLIKEVERFRAIAFPLWDFVGLMVLGNIDKSQNYNVLRVK